MSKKTTVNCSKCGKKLKAIMFDSVNTDYAKDIAAQIISGDLFKVKCGSCHCESYLEYNFLYHDLKNGAMIWVINKETPDYVSKIREVQAMPKPPYKMLRIVEDINALREKVACLENNRNDRVVELCKVFIAYNLLSQRESFDFRNAFYTIADGKEVVFLYDNNNNSICCELTDDIYDTLKDLYSKSTFAVNSDDNFVFADHDWAEYVLTCLMEADSEIKDSSEEIETLDSATLNDSDSNKNPDCEKENIENAAICKNNLSKTDKKSNDSQNKEDIAVSETEDTQLGELNINDECKKTFIQYGVDDDYGLIPSKPVHTKDSDEQFRYLQSLHTIDGDVIKWNHRGSCNIDGMIGLVDIYDAYLTTGKEYKTIYLNANGTQAPTFAPKGFSYINDSFNSPEKNIKRTKLKKLGKIGLIAGIVIAVLVICIFFFIPEFNYHQACRALDSGDYDKSYSAFEKLGDYRDSELMQKECIYQKACSKIDSGLYSAAVELLEEIDDYSDSKSKMNQAMYNYVLKHKNNNDPATFDYLKRLKRVGYKNSTTIYNTLYEWKITVLAINSDEDDETTNKDSISRHKSIYFHLKLTGGEPNASTRIFVKPHYPSGEIGEYTFNDEWIDGETGWYGWYDGLYDYPEYGATGTLQCKFYDDEGNLIGVDSVRVTR